MSEERPSLAFRIAAAFLATAILWVFVYGVTFGIFYFTADNVECGNIAGVIPYCSGTYESSQIDQEIKVNRTLECYENGDRVNCSEEEIQSMKNQVKFYEQNWEEASE